ncbi:MAG: GNAT family N-acetyltransferase [Spirochaetaceae bacterium]|nr:GNAT family N-acetyltransferase [Spirochaetaceae bacterium]
MDESGLTFRRATAADKASVLALCAKIWEGDDYIPACFEAWAGDEEGEFCLAFAPDAAKGGERLVGLAKLSWLAPGHAWLEGLRKDPDSGIGGLGQALARRFLARLAREPGLESLRFSTYFENAASIALNTRLGFREVARFSRLGRAWEAGAELPQPSPLVTPLGPRDREALFAYLRASPARGAFLHEAWRSYPWDEGLFAGRYLETGACFGIRGARGALRGAAAALVSGEKGTGAIVFLDAEDGETGALLVAEAERRMRAGGAREAEAFLGPGAAATRACLEAAGYAPWERAEDYLVFEYPLELLEARRR